ncbi:helix-turn-helix domain-containing protein, partial [Lactiplantibacillus plantarum]|nr:helix-turn-helix domain-containing protein [Lactiplantibacillus plantarum]MCT3242523.1 helix-turn-helix domain-containing protein [Lactiplantibacillus plantarum]MCT3245606.1 helix-turn-helix domain-containing protein [Lactiplantibacillus plantarum]MCT3247373.1 helix-turn-helix domain-containing protein [Lactiplantibacillus plantarum]MCT3247589.1 helix-turn-helix domain-containing protein [Lactiplantibacillus plantarum]
MDNNLGGFTMTKFNLELRISIVTQYL